MDWLCPDILFALFDADSGTIPTLGRVCKLWRAVVREYIRLYRDRVLRVNYIVEGSYTALYTTTSDGVVNGIRIDYEYTTPPFLSSYARYKYLVPMCITEICNGVRHGRCVEFIDGDISKYYMYDNDDVVLTVEFKLPPLVWVRKILTEFKKDETVDDEALNITTINRGRIRYKFTPDGRIHHKIPISDSYIHMREMPHPVQNFLLSYRDGTPRFRVKMIHNHWISEATYYAPDGAVKMVFMHRYKNAAAGEINYDNGYRIVRRSTIRDIIDHIAIYSGDTIVYEYINGKSKICRCTLNVGESPLRKCVKCQHTQLKQDLTRAWGLISEIKRRYKF